MILSKKKLCVIAGTMLMFGASASAHASSTVSGGTVKSQPIETVSETQKAPFFGMLWWW